MFIQDQLKNPSDRSSSTTLGEVATPGGVAFQPVTPSTQSGLATGSGPLVPFSTFTQGGSARGGGQQQRGGGQQQKRGVTTRSQSGPKPKWNTSTHT